MPPRPSPVPSELGRYISGTGCTLHRYLLLGVQDWSGLGHDVQTASPSHGWLDVVKSTGSGEPSGLGCVGIGWALDKRLTRQLTLKALEMAVLKRRPPPGLVHHSDRGSQYASADYQALLATHGLQPSMSRKGNCYPVTATGRGDNAPMESFFASLKSECVYRQLYACRVTARTSVFDYIEVFYNCQRMHSSLNYMRPHAYEQLPLVT